MPALETFEWFHQERLLELLARLACEPHNVDFADWGDVLEINAAGSSFYLRTLNIADLSLSDFEAQHPGGRIWCQQRALCQGEMEEKSANVLYAGMTGRESGVQQRIQEDKKHGEFTLHCHLVDFCQEQGRTEKGYAFVGLPQLFSVPDFETSTMLQDVEKLLVMSIRGESSNSAPGGWVDSWQPDCQRRTAGDHLLSLARKDTGSPLPETQIQAAMQISQAIPIQLKVLGSIRALGSGVAKLVGPQPAARAVDGFLDYATRALARCSAWSWVLMKDVPRNEFLDVRGDGSNALFGPNSGRGPFLEAAAVAQATGEPFRGSPDHRGYLNFWLLLLVHELILIGIIFLVQ